MYVVSHLPLAMVIYVFELDLKVSAHRSKFPYTGRDLNVDTVLRTKLTC